MNNTDKNNSNNDAYWQEKGYKKRPNNCKELLPKESKRQKNKEKFMLNDGRGTIDSMFDPLCKDDY